MFGGTGNDSLRVVHRRHGRHPGQRRRRQRHADQQRRFQHHDVRGQLQRLAVVRTGGTSVSMVSGGGDTTLSSSGGTSVTMFGPRHRQRLPVVHRRHGCHPGSAAAAATTPLSSSGGTSILDVRRHRQRFASSSEWAAPAVSIGQRRQRNDTLTKQRRHVRSRCSAAPATTPCRSTGGTGVTLVSGGGGNDTSSATAAARRSRCSAAPATTPLSSTGGTSVSMVMQRRRHHPQQQRRHQWSRCSAAPATTPCRPPAARMSPSSPAAVTTRPVLQRR